MDKEIVKCVCNRALFSLKMKVLPFATRGVNWGKADREKF
jgi:hypothetical protein